MFETVLIIQILTQPAPQEISKNTNLEIVQIDRLPSEADCEKVFETWKDKFFESQWQQKDTDKDTSIKTTSSVRHQCISRPLINRKFG